MTVALTLEVLFLGLATAASLARAGASQTRLVVTSIGLGCLIVLSAIVGAVILGGISGTPYAAVLGFGSAALLYLVGVVGVTMLRNVPRNNALDALDPQSTQASSYWPTFLREWTAWKCVAARASSAACRS